MNILYINNWELNNPLTISTTIPNLKVLSSFGSINKIVLVTPEYVKSDDTINISKVIHKPIYLDSCTLPSIFKYICQEIKLAKFLLKLTKEYKFNRILARGSPSGGRAWGLSKKTKIPFYVESYEPHSDYMYDAGVWTKLDPRFIIQKYWEKGAMRYASGLFPVSNNYKKKLIDIGVSKDKIAVIPCSADIDKFKFDINRRDYIRKKLNIQKDDIVGIYVGKFGGIYYDKEAFEAFEIAFKKIKTFHLILLSPISSSDLKNKLDMFADINPNRIYHCFVHQSKVADYLSASDFAYALIKSKPSTLYCSAIKIGEYWANGLPIVLSKGVGDDAKILEETKLGAIYNIEYVNDILSIIQQTNYKAKIVDLARKYRNPRMIRDGYIKLGFIK